MKRPSFYPPKPNVLIRAFMKIWLGWFKEHFATGGFKLEISKEDLEKLRRNINYPCLILPNHPTSWDPLVVLELSYKLGKPFYYVSAYEVFNYERGLRGWFFQRMGVYSLIRGKTDMPSLEKTIELLSTKNEEGKSNQVVIFIEGEISSTNDVMLPLNEGVIKLGQLAQRKLQKINVKHNALVFSPIFIQYHYPQKNLIYAIEKSIRGLEEALDIKVPGGTSIHDRLRKIGIEILHSFALELDFKLDEAASLDEKISAINNEMLLKLENLLGLNPSKPTGDTEDTIARVRSIQRRLDQAINWDFEKLSPYTVKRINYRNKVLERLYPVVERVINFLTIYDGYLPDHQINQRYVELILRYEKEVFGALKFQHPKVAKVVVSDGIKIDHETQLTSQEIEQQIEAFYEAQHVEVIDA